MALETGEHNIHLYNYHVISNISLYNCLTSHVFLIILPPDVAPIVTDLILTQQMQDGYEPGEMPEVKIQ